MIRVGRDIQGPVHERAEVCVVGSGSGGAVAAAILAEAGRDVVLLEEGGYFTAADFTGREGEMYPLLYRDRAGQYTADGGVNVLQGRAVGGTTLINAADCERIPSEVLAHWEKVYGVEGVNEATLRDSYARVEVSIGVVTIEPSMVNRNNALMMEGA
jgi:choline dehydrogenase-like flavoprotein